MFELTSKDIQTYIMIYQQRLDQARAKLESLPGGYLPYPEFKKREKQRQSLQAEIEHVRNLMRLAQEGIAIRIIEETNKITNGYKEKEKWQTLQS